jgi:putative Mg2+ transporter-C (MgtC) family protein
VGGRLMIYENQIILRLVLGAILGGLIGLEREVHNRPAGLRTHVLVTVGSTLIMLVSMYGFQGLGSGGSGGEPARLAAQVVSGIGFLGAGTIMREGNDVRGLTTAASIWVCGGIGLAIGSGYYIGAFTTTAIVLFTLVSLGFFERQVFKGNYQRIELICSERNGLIGEIGLNLGNLGISIKDIRLSSYDTNSESDIKISISLKLSGKVAPDLLFEKLKEIQGIKEIIWNRENKLHLGRNKDK